MRLFVAQRGDGLGWRFTTTVGTSGITHDTLVPERTISVASVEAIQAWPNATVAAVARLGAAGMPQQFEGRAGWMPIHPLTLGGTIPPVTMIGAGALQNPGALCVLSVASLDFGSTAVGQSKLAFYVVRNPGTAPLILDVVPTCSDFVVISVGGPSTLAAGDSLVELLES